MNGLSDAAIRSEIDQVVKKGYGVAPGEPRVLGLRSKPESALAKEMHHTVAGKLVTVRVAPCVSALAAREVLVEHGQAEQDWLVIVTDRDESDLGAGVVGHLIGQRLRQVDPWLSVRGVFGASGIDRSLTRLPQNRLIAQQLLKILDEDRGKWPVAPAGLLTLDHVAKVVAQRELGLPNGTLDGVAVLRWAAAGPVANSTAGTTAVQAIARLRRLGGDVLVEALLDWLAKRCGAAEDIVRAELGEGRSARLVSLGVATHHLREARTTDPTASAAWERFVAAHGVAYGRPGAADALGARATVVAGDLLDSGENWSTGSGLLTEADKLLADVGATKVAAGSLLLPTGLKQRFHELATVMRTAGHSDRAAVDAAWQAVTAHALVRLAPARQRPAAYAPTEAAVRLRRWEASRRAFGAPQPSSSQLSFAEMCRQQVRENAWVDSAIHDAAGGVADLDLSTALAEVVSRARETRAEQDHVFSDELARITEIGDGQTGALTGEGDPVWPLEHVLREVIAPLARTTRTLQIVLDGMTARVAAELVEDILGEGRGWVEALPPGVQKRMAGLAVLPTLTEHSRTSLLTGRLRSGSQADEKREHPQAVTALGAGPAKIFHKADLDRVPDGHRLAHDVRDALGDSSVRLVTCVLNTIDDALDRSDPEGIDWRLDSVKHLAALLEEAAAVGRAVVLTSDHGHVLERRKGKKHPGVATSARSREVGEGVRDGEVLVRGPRVLGESPIVLAVDDTVRYTDLRAGYHGGGTPAEAVVPIVLLWPGAVPDKVGDAFAGEQERPFPYVEASSQRPVWWDHPVPGQVPPQEPSAPPPPEAKVAAAAQESLTGPGHAVVTSAVWKAQRAIVGRVALDDAQCAHLIDELVAAPGTRLTTSAVARILGIPEARGLGAISQLQKLLNVEGYPVVRRDQGMLVLDAGLLKEQFGL